MAQDKSLSTKLQISVDPRIVIGILLVIIIAMLLLWRPWSGRLGSERTLEVRGETTITAKPDEFIFYPSYQIKNVDKNIALSEVSKKSEELVAKLKELGVSENKIKTNTTSYDYWEGPQAKDPTYALQVTITVPNMDQAQKVQNYLITTSPTGSVSPQAGFSEAKRKQLEINARTKAIDDAKQKADRTAKELGFKIAKIKAVSDGGGFDTLAIEARSATDKSVQASPPSGLDVNPGENELPYVVTVVYFIR